MNIRQTQPTCSIYQFRVFAEGLDHSEGLAFDADGTLWAGGELGQIYRIDGNGVVTEVARVGGFCLGLTFSRKQELWVCNSRLGSLQHLDRGGSLLHSIDRVGERKLITPNFSVFDSEGNLYFSDSGEWGQVNGHIYRLRANGRAEHFAGPFAFSNGLALSADERFLYVAESLKDDVIRLPILPDGKAGEIEIYATGLERVPDGMALDAAGNLYVTCYATHNIYCVSTQRELSLFAFDPLGTMLAAPTNIAFGPDGSRELYVANLGRWHICKTRIDTSGQKLANQKL